MIKDYQHYAKECKRFIGVIFVLIFCVFSEGVIFGQDTSDDPWNRAEEGLIPYVNNDIEGKYNIRDKKIFKGVLEPIKDSAQNKFTLKQMVSAKRKVYYFEGTMDVKIAVYMQSNIWKELYSQNNLNKEITILAEVAEENGERCLELRDYVMGWGLNNLIRPSEEKNEWEKIRKFIEYCDTVPSIKIIQNNRDYYESTIRNSLDVLGKYCLLQKRLQFIREERKKIDNELREQSIKALNYLWGELKDAGVPSSKRGSSSPQYLSLETLQKCQNKFEEFQKLKAEKTGPSPTASHSQPINKLLWEQIQKFKSSFYRLRNETPNLPKNALTKIYSPSDPTIPTIKEIEDAYWKREDELKINEKIWNLEGLLKTYSNKDIEDWWKELKRNTLIDKFKYSEPVFPKPEEENDLDKYVNKFMECYRTIEGYYEQLKKQAGSSELQTRIENLKEILKYLEDILPSKSLTNLLFKVNELKALGSSSDVSQLNTQIGNTEVEFKKELNTNLQELWEREKNRGISEWPSSAPSIHEFKELSDFVEDFKKAYTDLKNKVDTSSQLSEKVKKRVQELKELLKKNEIKEILNASDKQRIHSSFIDKLDSLPTDEAITKIEEDIKKALENGLNNKWWQKKGSLEGLPYSENKTLQEYSDEVLGKYKELITEEKYKEIMEGSSKLKDFNENTYIKMILEKASTDTQNKISKGIAFSDYYLKMKDLTEAEKYLKEALDAFKQGVQDGLENLTHNNIKLSQQPLEKFVEDAVQALKNYKRNQEKLVKEEAEKITNYLNNLVENQTIQKITEKVDKNFISFIKEKLDKKHNLEEIEKDFKTALENGLKKIWEEKYEIYRDQWKIPQPKSSSESIFKDYVQKAILTYNSMLRKEAELIVERINYFKNLLQNDNKIKVIIKESDEKFISSLKEKLNKPDLKGIEEEFKATLENGLKKIWEGQKSIYKDKWRLEYPSPRRNTFENYLQDAISIYDDMESEGEGLFQGSINELNKFTCDRVMGEILKNDNMREITNGISECGNTRIGLSERRKKLMETRHSFRNNIQDGLKKIWNQGKKEYEGKWNIALPELKEDSIEEFVQEAKKFYNKMQELELKNLCELSWVKTILKKAGKESESFSHENLWKLKQAIEYGLANMRNETQRYSQKYYLSQDSSVLPLNEYRNKCKEIYDKIIKSIEDYISQSDKDAYTKNAHLVLMSNKYSLNLKGTLEINVSENRFDTIDYWLVVNKTNDGSMYLSRGNAFSENDTSEFKVNFQESEDIRSLISPNEKMKELSVPQNIHSKFLLICVQIKLKDKGVEEWKANQNYTITLTPVSDPLKTLTINEK